MRAAGITRITGKIVADGSFFDTQRYNPGWFTSYASEYYAAQTAALTVAPNADYDSGTVIVKVKGGSRGRRPTAEHDPGGGQEVRPSGQPGDHDGVDERVAVAQARREHDHRPRPRPQRPQWSGLVTVDKPELYAAAVFRKRAQPARRRGRGRDQAGHDAGHQAHPGRARHVDDAGHAARPFLKLSNNLHAEALTKTMGTLDGRPGSWPDGLARTTAYLRQLGVPMKGSASPTARA